MTRSNVNGQEIVPHHDSVQNIPSSPPQIEHNIFKDCDEDRALVIRENVISMVLSTDMTHHFSELGKLKTKINSPDFPAPDVKEDKLLLMNVVSVAADRVFSLKFQIQIWKFQIQISMSKLQFSTGTTCDSHFGPKW